MINTGVRRRVYQMSPDATNTGLPELFADMLKELPLDTPSGESTHAACIRTL